MPRRALLVAAFDSQLKWVAGIGNELAHRGFECRVVVPQVRSALSAGQISAAGLRSVESVGWSELVERAMASDVVVCGLSGPFTLRFTVDLAARAAPHHPSPVVVTGWVGVIIEKITAGYLDRVGSDIVAVNCVDDLEHFVTVAQQLELSPDNLLLSGLPILTSRAASTRGGPIRTVLFADQPTVPSPAERTYLYRRLIDYASAHPEREVLLKPRHRPGEDTFHRMTQHPEDLLAGVERPPNFRLDYTPIREILPDVDLLLTMSSTACLEALGSGSRVGLILDLGVHERHGNHVFLASGLLRTFDQLIADDIGVPDRSWLGSYFFDRPGSATEQIVDRVEKLLASGERPAQEIRESAYFSSTARYLRGTPVPAAVRRRTGRTFVRELVPPALRRRTRGWSRRSPAR